MTTYGAMERYGQGPLEMAKGALEGLTINAMFRGTAGMPYSSKAAIWPSTFMAIDIAEGRPSDQIVLSGATGLILAGLSGKGDPSLGAMSQIRSELRSNPTIQKLMLKREAELRAGEKLRDIAEEVADRYISDEMQGIKARIEAEQIGKTPVEGTPKVNLTERALSYNKS